MYESWRADIEDKNEFAKSFSIFLGSFFNPEAAQQILKVDNPGHVSTNEEFEESTRIMIADKKRALEDNENKLKRRRRRRVKVIN